MKSNIHKKTYCIDKFGRKHFCKDASRRLAKSEKHIAKRKERSTGKNLVFAYIDEFVLPENTNPSIMGSEEGKYDNS